MPSWTNTSPEAPARPWAVLLKMAAYLLLASRREVKVFCFPSLVWMARA